MIINIKEINRYVKSHVLQNTMLIFFAMAIISMILGCNRTAKDIEDESIKKNGGIGISFKIDSTGMFTLPIITEIIPGTPAQSILNVNTYIQKVNGNNCKNKTFDEISEYIKGVVGTRVTITVSSDRDCKNPIQREFIRANVNNKIPGDFYFGEIKYYVDIQENELRSMYRAAIRNNEITYNFGTLSNPISATLKLSYYNDSVFRGQYNIVTANNLQTYKQQLLDSFLIKNYGNPNVNGTQPEAKYYWVCGNMRIDYFDTFGHVSICYSDITRERRIMANNERISLEEKRQREIEEQKENFRKQNMTIEDYVADKAVKEYEIAERQGDKMQMYVQAGLCAAAFLQAQDEPNYRKWKAQERKIGDQIGIPHY